MSKCQIVGNLLHWLNFCILNIVLVNKLIWHVHFCISIGTVDSDTALENSADHVQMALSEANYLSKLTVFSRGFIQVQKVDDEYFTNAYTHTFDEVSAIDLLVFSIYSI